MRKYVDLMADHEWTEADLQRRADDYVANEFPDAPTLAAKAHALSLGYGLMTTEEQARSRALYDMRQTVREEVAAALGDMALLRSAWEVEAAQVALRVLVEDDAEARGPYLAVIDNASPATLALVAQRNRYPAPQEEQTP